MCSAASPSVNTELKPSLPTADHEDQCDQISDVSLMLSEEQSILKQFAAKQEESDIDSEDSEYHISPCSYCGRIMMTLF